MKNFSDFGIDLHGKSGESCVRWPGAPLTTGLGYGRITVNKKTWLAHRWVWAQINGDIPRGMQVLHRCDNPICVNPKHLFLGTAADNMADKVAKSRQARGEQITRNRSDRKREEHPNAKLTGAMAKEIRLIASSRMKPGGRYGRADLAKQFGVSQSLIKQVVGGVAWA